MHDGDSCERDAGNELTAAVEDGRAIDGGSGSGEVRDRCRHDGEMTGEAQEGGAAEEEASDKSDAGGLRWMERDTGCHRPAIDGCCGESGTG